MCARFFCFLVKEIIFLMNFLRDYGVFCRYTSVLVVAVGVLLFLLTSFSDPGIIKAENVSQYLSAYSYDNILYSQKECSTCKIPKLVFFFFAFGGTLARSVFVLNSKC